MVPAVCSCDVYRKVSAKSGALAGTSCGIADVVNALAARKRQSN